MSGIGISPTDVVNGLKACHWIYQNCFVQANAAHVKYKQFGQQINGLHQTLGTLHTQVAFIDSTYGHSHHGFTVTHGLRQDLVQVFADFQLTLKDCRKLLTTHKSLDRNQAGFVQNVRWNAGIQTQCEALQNRIQAHNSKIQLLLGTLQVILNNSIYDAITAPPDLDPGLVPEPIAVKFHEALSRALAEKNTSLRDLQMDEKLLTLHTHFNASTRDNPRGVEQSITQHLNLLKSAWLISELRADDAFRYAPPGFPYRLTLQNIQRSVSRELERSDLTRFDNHDILALEQPAFDILLPEEPQSVQLQPDERPWEKKLLELGLPDAPGCVRHTLLVYRSGPSSLRLVREKVARETNAVSRESENISVFSDLLLPYYAAARDDGPLTMVLRNRTGTGKTVYELSELRDVFALQRAITGHEVMSDINGVAWFTHKTFKRHLEGDGRVQIWRLKPLQSMEPELHFEDGQDSASHAGNGSNVISESSRSTNSTFANVTRDVRSFSGTESSIITMADSSVIATGTLPPPMLVILTQSDKGTFEYVTLDLSRGVEKYPNHCECGRFPDRCLRVVLRKSDGGLLLRRFSTELSDIPGPQLDRWNMAIWSRISVHSADAHPDLASRAVQDVKSEFLSLDFKTIVARKKFDTHLSVVAKLRDEEDRKVQSFVNHAKFLAHRPRIARDASAASRTNSTANSTSPMTPNGSQTTLRPTHSVGSTTTSSTRHSRASSAPKLPELEFSRPTRSRGSFWS